jgi:hypothetical protein
VTEHAKAELNDEDLIDLAVYQTLNHAGMIYVMTPEAVPGGPPLSAILRY